MRGDRGESSFEFTIVDRAWRDYVFINNVKDPSRKDDVFPAAMLVRDRSAIIIAPLRATACATEHAVSRFDSESLNLRQSPCRSDKCAIRLRCAYSLTSKV